MPSRISLEVVVPMTLPRRLRSKYLQRPVAPQRQRFIIPDPVPGTPGEYCVPAHRNQNPGRWRRRPRLHRKRRQGRRRPRGAERAKEVTEARHTLGCGGSGGDVGGGLAHGLVVELEQLVVGHVLELVGRDGIHEGTSRMKDGSRGKSAKGPIRCGSAGACAPAEAEALAPASTKGNVMPEPLAYRRLKYPNRP